MNHDQHHHQENGNHETSRPISPWLVGGFMLALFWGGFYLAFNSGGFRQDVYESNVVNWAGGGTVAATPPDPKVIGKRLYTQNCIVCHQANGMGVAGQFPPLAGSEWVLGDGKHAENHLVMLLLNGLQGPFQVKGQLYNNAMVPWKQLTDDQIAAILTYIRSDWGNNASPIDSAFVAKIRTETAAQSEPWMQAQLEAFAPVKDSAPATAPATK